MKCQQECTSAIQSKKKIIVAHVDKYFYTPTDASWLGLALGKEMCHDLTNPATFDEDVENMMSNRNSSDPLVERVVPDDEESIKAFFSQRKGGEVIAAKLLENGYDDAEGLKLLWKKRAEELSALGLKSAQKLKLEAALEELFG